MGSENDRSMDYVAAMNALIDLKNNSELIHESISACSLILWTSYEKLVEQGFNEQQALAIVINRKLMLQ
jgi:carbamate kinase